MNTNVERIVGERLAYLHSALKQAANNEAKAESDSIGAHTRLGRIRAHIDDLKAEVTDLESWVDGDRS